MSSTAPSQAFVQLTSSEEGNWLSLGRALTTVLCQGLRPFITREMEIFYNKVTAAFAALPAVPCTCVYDPRRKKNQYHDISTCAWAQLFQGVHLGNKPNWKQSDPIKWMDPNIGPWEIAKLFIPDIGGHTVIESAEDMDITGILNLMYWCNHFTVQRALIKDVRETRNTKWVHVPQLELSEAEKRAAFETIEKLLQDPVFVGDPDAQGALQEVLAIKYTSDVHIFKAEDLSQFKREICSVVTSLKGELESLKRDSESKKNEQQRSRVEGRLRNLQETLEKLEKKSATSASSLSFILVLSMAIITFLIKRARCMRRNSLAACLTLWLLFCSGGILLILDQRSYRDDPRDGTTSTSVILISESPTGGRTLERFGSCTEKDYLIWSRVCFTSFVQTLQMDPNKSCRWVFMKKLHNCAKNIALHCYKNESDDTKRSIERSFNEKSYISYQQQRYCNGINFQISYPPGILEGNQCKKYYIAEKEKCEASYIATYKENKADETLCRKYAEAKDCVKSVTLALCKVTPEQRDEINFIYDGFNPFCFNQSDPPTA